MAQYRFSSQIIGRRDGRSAVAAAAYRAGASLADERTGQVHDFTRRGGILHTEIMAPDHAPEWMRDRQRLWNAVELAEKRRDAQLCREVQLSLPHELTDDQRLALVRDFVSSQFVARGMIADVAIHGPSHRGDERNHHAHVMLTMRELTGGGFGNKARDWNERDLLQGWREQWAQEQNRTLLHYGHAARVDHRSLEAQGIDREATQHLGPHAHQMEQRGATSRIGQENRATDARNQQRADVHRQIVVVDLALERHRRQSAKVMAERISALENSFTLAVIDDDRRFDRQRQALVQSLDRQYGRSERTMAAELQAIKQRQEATGWRRFLRKVIGAERRDHIATVNLSRSMDSITRRRAEAMDSLARKHEAERRAIAEGQRNKVAKLKSDLTADAARKEKRIIAAQAKARAQAEREAKKPLVPHRDVTLPDEQRSKGIARKDRLRKRRGEREGEDVSHIRDRFERAKNPAPQQAPKPVPVRERFISQPAPAPAPSGTHQIPKRVRQQIPEKEIPRAKSAPQPRRDIAKVSRGQDQPQGATPTSSTPEQHTTPASSLRAKWSERSEQQRDTAKAKPSKDRSRDRDFDRDR